MRRPGEALSRVQLLDARLGHRLREPLERRRRLRPLPAREDRPAVRRHSLETVRGVGYRLARTSWRDDGVALPIRIRLTLPFAVAMAVVLAALGRLRLPARRLDAPSRHDRPEPAASQAAEATSRGSSAAKPPLDRDRARSGVSFAQVLARRRRRRRLRRRRGSPAAPGRRTSSQPVARPAARAAARRVATAGPSGSWRLLASPVPAATDGAVLVLASSLDARDESLERLRERAPRRLAARAPARDARRLRARRRGAAAGRGDAAAGGRHLGRDPGQPAAGARRPRTRSRGSPRR